MSKKLKIAVSSYSFAKLIRNGKITPLDTIRLAKEIGYDGIEIVDFQAPEGMSKTDWFRQLAEEAKRLSFPVANLAVSANFAQQGDALSEEIERVKELVDAAAVLGTPSMRHDVVFDLGSFATYAQALPALAEGCRAVTEYAAGKGIHTVVENHGFIFQDPERLEALYQAVDHPNFGILADMGNFLCGDCDPVISIGKLRESIRLVHAKDFLRKSGESTDPGEGFFKSRGGSYLRGTIIGHGAVCVKSCLYALKNIGYDGWISVEFEGMEDVMTALRINLDNLRAYWEAV